MLHYSLPQHFEPASRVFTIYSYSSSVLHTTRCFTTSGAIYLCELHSFRYSVHFCFRLHIKTANSFRTRISSELLIDNSYIDTDLRLKGTRFGNQLRYRLADIELFAVLQISVEFKFISERVVVKMMMNLRILQHKVNLYTSYRNISFSEKALPSRVSQSVDYITFAVVKSWHHTSTPNMPSSRCV